MKSLKQVWAAAQRNPLKRKKQESQLSPSDPLRFLLFFCASRMVDDGDFIPIPLTRDFIP